MRERVKNSLFLIGMLILFIFGIGLLMILSDRSPLQAGIHLYYGRVNIFMIFISMLGISFIAKDAIIEDMFDDEGDSEDQDESEEID